jgi:hypothetical protein
MKKFPIFAALALLLAGFCSGHAQAATPKADCLLIVNNKPSSDRHRRTRPAAALNTDLPLQYTLSLGGKDSSRSTKA